MIRHCLDFLDGARAVVVGDTPLIGRPAADLLRRLNTDVTLCSADEEGLPSYTRVADIVVVDAGRPRLIDSSWLKPGAIVIDGGMNVIGDSVLKAGKKKIVGDVDFESV
eukprot:TRINITY_DN120746_c0_g1_i1.p6 TRINITY_DN120746_c0_g1~~TRINITY_DN120746_c0_g1_i1.p6  ORF type:complete len:109 (+),score=14.47 TRINITY_DN120746_c0_g1_i1:827-1153(+)